MKLLKRIVDVNCRARFLMIAALLTQVLGCQVVELDRENATVSDPLGITNGTPTNWESWQGVVAIVWMVDGYGPAACSGSLIAPNIVLTAGHCVWSVSGGTDFRDAPEGLEIRAGADVYTAGDWFHVADVLEAIVHPGWNGNLTVEGSDISVDIGMLLLSQDVIDMEPYPLREPPAPAISTVGTVVGYGNGIDGDFTTQGIHRMGGTTVLAVTDEFIQVGNPSGLCHGDSGGGFFTEQYGEQVVTGINSWVADGICNPLADGWVVNVATYIDDIRFVMDYWNPPVEEPDAGLDTDEGDTDTGTDIDTDMDTDADNDTDTVDGADTDSDEDTDAAAGTGDSCNCSVAGRTDAKSMYLFVMIASAWLS